MGLHDYDDNTDSTPIPDEREGLSEEDREAQAHTDQLIELGDGLVTNAAIAILTGDDAAFEANVHQIDLASDDSLRNMCKVFYTIAARYKMYHIQHAPLHDGDED